MVSSTDKPKHAKLRLISMHCSKPLRSVTHWHSNCSPFWTALAIPVAWSSPSIRCSNAFSPAVRAFATSRHFKPTLTCLSFGTTCVFSSAASDAVAALTKSQGLIRGRLTGSRCSVFRQPRPDQFPLLCSTLSGLGWLFLPPLRRIAHSIVKVLLTYFSTF